MGNKQTAEFVKNTGINRAEANYVHELANRPDRVFSIYKQRQ